RNWSSDIESAIGSPAGFPPPGPRGQKGAHVRGGTPVGGASHLISYPWKARTAARVWTGSAQRPVVQTVATSELVRRWQGDRDPAARQELCDRFMPLARRLAARYRNSNDPFEDLVQVASVGLLGAIERFDPDRETSFTSFAVPTILGELKRYFRITGWSAHVPRRAQEIALLVDRASREIAASTGRAPRVAH